MLQKLRTWFSNRPSAAIRVLAFTASRHRPLMLRHCIMQLQRQSYPVDHAIYVNSSDDEGPDCTTVHYNTLLDDLRNDASAKILIGYGKSKTYHENYVSALQMTNVDDYDLFLKIDDDDIYLRSYVKDIVDDFAVNRWDYSGTCSQGLLNGRRWYPQLVRDHLGLTQEDRDLGIQGIMPPSAAFSRKAIRVILDAPGSHIIEDQYWRRILAQTPSLVPALRADKNFIYHVHGGNLSTAEWLQP